MFLSLLYRPIHKNILNNKNITLIILCKENYTDTRTFRVWMEVFVVAIRYHQTWRVTGCLQEGIPSTSFTTFSVMNSYNSWLIKMGSFTVGLWETDPKAFFFPLKGICNSSGCASAAVAWGKLSSHVSYEGKISQCHLTSSCICCFI